MKLSISQRFLQSYAVILINLALSSLLLGIVFYLYIPNQRSKDLQNNIDSHHKITSEILYRFLVYEQLLWSGTALFYASEHIDRSEWKVFVESVDIANKWPGVQGIGFAELVKLNQLDSFEAEVRADGFKDFHVTPQTPRDFYTSIKFIEPFDWRNQRAFGYDMWTNPARNQAMHASMTTGEAKASGVVTLLQETESDSQNGFILYAPLYKIRNAQADKYTLRNMAGWIYAPFRVNEFMQGLQSLTEKSIFLKIDDVTESTPSPLYRTSNTAYDPAMASTETIIDIYGRKWSIKTHYPKHQLPNSAINIIVMLLTFFIIANVVFVLCVLNYKREQSKQDDKFTKQHKRIINDSKLLKVQLENLQNENRQLLRNIENLQDWLSDRELRIKELKLEKSSKKDQRSKE